VPDEWDAGLEDEAPDDQEVEEKSELAD